MAGQFPHFVLKPLATQQRQRLPFFRTQETSVSLPQGTLVSFLHFTPDSFTTTSGLTGQHRVVARGKGVSWGAEKRPQTHTTASSLPSITACLHSLPLGRPREGEHGLTAQANAPGLRKRVGVTPRHPGAEGSFVNTSITEVGRSSEPTPPKASCEGKPAHTNNSHFKHQTMHLQSCGSCSHITKTVAPAKGFRPQS